MGAKSVLTMQASLPGEPEEVPLGPMDVVAATLEVVETRDMEVEDMTIDLEDTDMGMGGLETTVAEARVAMIATQEEITETIMTTEMGHWTHKGKMTWPRTLRISLEVGVRSTIPLRRSQRALQQSYFASRVSHQHFGRPGS